MVPVILLILTPPMPDIFTRQKKNAPKPESKTTPTAKPATTATTKPQEEKEPTVDAQPATSTTPLSIATTFCRNPRDVQLGGQDPDENIILFLRQDFITNFGWIFSFFIFALLPVLIFPLLSLANISLDFLPFRFVILIVIFYYLILLGYAFANFVTWFYTIGVISDKKFVDIDFHNLSSIHVGTVNLKDASDAKYKQAGFFQSFFDYGDIIVTIEATKEQFIFERTPRPALITDLLSDMIGEK